MKAKYLAVEGFGPFTQRYEVDFDQLGAEGCFLLTGPTGAGKSMIIDAMVWALYGQVARHEASTKERVRSTLVGPEVPTSVEFAFTVGGKDYWVRRTPDYERKKKSGEGTTPAPATATLVELDDGAILARDFERGKPLATKPRDVTPEIERIIGLNRTQFVQTIVLPQGEFAQFLRSSSDQRARLLKHIFGTHMYEDFVQTLKEKANLAEAEVKDRRKDFHYAARSWQKELEVPPPEAEALESALAASHASEAGNTLNILSAAMGSLESDVARLASGVETKQQRAEELRELNSAHQAVENAHKNVHAAKEECLKLSLDVDTDTVAAAEEKAATYTKLQGGLEQSARDEEAMKKKETQLARDTKRHSKLVSQHEATLTSLEELPHRISEAENALGEATEVATTLASVEAELTDAERIAGLLCEYEQYAKAAAQARSEAAQAEAAKREADNAYLQGFTRWAGATAARLAEELRSEGSQPCPVCGSIEHPKLASVPEDALSDEGLHALEQGKEEAAQRYADAEGRAKEAEARATTLRKQIEGHDRNEVHTSITALQEKKKSAAGAALRLPELEKAVADLRKRAEELERTAAQEDKDIAVLTTQNAAVREEIDQLRSHLADERAGFESIAARIADLAAQHRAARAQAEALRTYNATAHALREAEEAVKARIAGTDYESTNAHEVERAFQQAQGDYQDAVSSHSTAQTRLQRAIDEAQRTASAHRAWAEAEKAAEPVIEIAKLASGENSEKLRLSTFVLLERFERVVDRANEYIGAIYDNRYLLERTDESKGRAKAGLDMKIIDTLVDPDEPGRERPVGTASGGETFFISLALALALADIVTTENGGIQLQTLLIDEGFGSLDPGVLDNVLAVLRQLSDDGRLVGAISHVEAMKTEFSNHVIVEKNGDGTSRLAVHAG